jgi:hypothetical protein
MTELVERYVHRVGRYLPPKERVEIEAELRSQILDQLDDRYGPSPSQAEVASVLAELGHPHEMAASYSSDQYLVGPDLFPYMMLVLRYGWLLIPSIALFLNIFGSLILAEPATFESLIVDPVIAALQATVVFSGVVVLIFAVIERIDLDVDEEVFNPLTLPEVDDPSIVDRFEIPVAIIIETLVVLAFLYFLRVGGLTLHFNLTDPGDVIPVPVTWMVLLIVFSLAQLIVYVLMLRHTRWNIGVWILMTVLEVVGIICLYFAVLEPFFKGVVMATPALASIPLAQIVAIALAVLTLLNRLSKLVRLRNYRADSTPSRPVFIKHISSSG